jgi:probable rRNA maturation factor
VTNQILISSESRFIINRKYLKELVENFLAEQKIKSRVELSILIVGGRKIRQLNKKYRSLDAVTPVLSFSQEEGGAFVAPPDGLLRLGDVVISYPQAVEMARTENKMVDQKIGELVSHGLKNLLGIG